MEEKINRIRANLLAPPEQMPALVLAYIGDAVYELYVRRYLIGSGTNKVNLLHKQAVNFVKASTQAKIIHDIKETLNPDEADIVRRGRNAKSGSVPKNADIIDYRHGTAFEALFGYLYLKGRSDRLEEIFERAIHLICGEIEHQGEDFNDEGEGN